MWGQTRYPTPVNRFRAHKYNSKNRETPLQIDIDNYGRDVFTVETLCIVPHSSLNNMEAYWAEQLQTYMWDPPLHGPRGYTIRECGVDPATYTKPKNMSRWWIGRTYTEETRIKIGNIHRRTITPEYVRQKQSKSHMGLIPTEATKTAARDKRIESVIQNGAKGVKLTKENILDIVKLHNSGITQTELATKYNVQVSVISRIMSGDRWGYITGIHRIKPVTKRNQPLGIEVANQIRELYKAGGTTYASLAEMYNVNKSTIANIIKGKLYPPAQ